MKLKKQKQRTLIIILIWMAVIFLMSNQQGEESGAVSGSVSYQAVSVVDKVLHWNLSEQELIARTEAIQYPVRKCAHMTEYAILAILLVRHLCTYTSLRKRKRCWLFAWILSIVYAATDEYHQTFVNGRSGNPVDVAIDATGACIGLLLFGLCYMILIKRRGDRNE